MHLENVDELSFVAGDLIILEEKIDDVWLKGYTRSPQESGIFPAKFVEVVVCIYVMMEYYFVVMWNFKAWFDLLIVSIYRLILHIVIC